jgi:Cu-Zn family superoxide dismutase
MRIVIFLLFLKFCLTLNIAYAKDTKIISTQADWIQNPDATADIMNNAGKKIGIIYAKQGTQGVLLRLKVQDFPAGIHGMHFHNIGDCSEHQHFQSAGGHIDTLKKPHGFFNPKGPHEGNLPNLIVDSGGNAMVEIYSQMVSIKTGKIALLDKDGSTLVIHQNSDDHISQPIGGAGERIACGVFKSVTH